MFPLDLYVKVRRAVMVENKSEREVARYFGIHRKTVRSFAARELDLQAPLRKRNRPALELISDGLVARQVVLREAAYHLYPDVFPKPDVQRVAAIAKCP